MTPALETKNLSKKYRICHESQGAYSTIVESVTRQAKKWGRQLIGKKDPNEPSYEEFWALKDVDFTCYPGDRIGIIGKNGAGKSTLLKILSRIIEPSQGSVKIQGRIASLLEVGTGFHPELTGRENIFLNGAILGMSRKEILKKFDEIIAFSEVERFLDTPVKYYSSGMYARLGFAIAAHLDPDILIVDEVLAVGDMQFQEKCLKKMDSVSQSGKTILFVSHNSAATVGLCNKGLYLESGQVRYFGAIEPCINEYLKSNKQATFTWKGDWGNEEFRIYRAELVRTKDFFYQDETAQLKIQCELLHQNPKGHFGVEIKNSRGQILAQSFINHHTPLNHHLTTPGRYTVTIPIPAELFWEGEYGVCPVYITPQQQKVGHEPISLKFPVYKPQQTGSASALTGSEGTLIKTPWTISQTEKSSS